MSMLEARRKWIDYLKSPDTKKATGYLVSGDDHEARCCLGHACHVLGAAYDPETGHYEGEAYYPPQHLVDELGLWNRYGGAKGSHLTNGQPHLAHWNDQSAHPVTPQEIGAYLETVILGGPDTPFVEIQV